MTTRGGPVSGTEALSLQGLPLDRMLLTRETQADLMDMAGNAMTSTVVCAIMLAGLIAVHEILDDGEESSTYTGDAEAKSLLVPSEVYSLVRSNLQVAEGPPRRPCCSQSQGGEQRSVLFLRETDRGSRFNL